MDVYVLVVISTLATGEERAEYRSYYSLEHCQQHAFALRQEASAERYNVKVECRSFRSYGLLMPSPKA